MQHLNTKSTGEREKNNISVEDKTQAKAVVKNIVRLMCHFSQVGFLLLLFINYRARKEEEGGGKQKLKPKQHIMKTMLEFLFRSSLNNKTLRERVLLQRNSFV